MTNCDLHRNLLQVRRQSESKVISTSITGTSSSHTICMAGGSAESLPKYSRLLSQSRGARNVGGEGQIFVTTKKTKFINPFDPLKVHGELTAYHRRWVHVFPRDKNGLAFQAHHAIAMEEGEDDDDDGFSSGSTLSPTRNASMGSFNTGSYTHGDGKGSPWLDGEFRSLSQAGRRSRFISGSSSLGDMLSGSLGSHDEQRISNRSGSQNTSTNHLLCARSMHTQPAKWDDYGTGPDILSESVKAVPPMKPAWCRPKKKLAVTERRMSDPSTKPVEDFTSVQRTGVDWKSLTEPACLPVTVDFFPSDSKLNQDYYQSPSKLVVSSYDKEFDGATGSRYVYDTCIYILWLSHVSGVTVTCL